jgi:hypothetical protein
MAQGAGLRAQDENQKGSLPNALRSALCALCVFLTEQ